MCVCMCVCVFVCGFRCECTPRKQPSADSKRTTHLSHIQESHTSITHPREPRIHSPARTRPHACSHRLHKCSVHSILNRGLLWAPPEEYIPSSCLWPSEEIRERISVSIFQSLFGCGFANTCRVQCRCQRNHSDNNSAHPLTEPWCLHDSGGSGHFETFG